MGCDLCTSKKVSEIPPKSTQTDHSHLPATSNPQAHQPHPVSSLHSAHPVSSIPPESYPTLSSSSHNYPVLDDHNLEIITPVPSYSLGLSTNPLSDLSSNDAIILLLGDSGSGKSSYLNLIYNCIHEHNTLDSLKIVAPSEKWPELSEPLHNPLSHFSVNSENPSFTKEIKFVQLNYPKKDKKFLFIDTPGFCRTNENQNSETVNLILSLLQQIERLDYVFYVHRSDHTKFESSLKETLALFQPTFQSLSPKVIAIYTFIGSKLDVKHDSLPFQRDLVQKKYHTINNTTFASALEEQKSAKKQKHNESLLQQNLSKLNSLLDSI